jgi:hypothetical protein
MLILVYEFYTLDIASYITLGRRTQYAIARSKTEFLGGVYGLKGVLMGLGEGYKLQHVERIM